MNQDTVLEVSNFQIELSKLINKHSQENNSNTPDFILAKYLYSCLVNFNFAIQQREKWYGRNFETGRTQQEPHLDYPPYKNRPNTDNSTCSLPNA